MVLLEGMVIFILVAYALAAIAPPIIFKRFGPLGIITIIVTIAGILSLPHLCTMIAEYFGWK